MISKNSLNFIGEFLNYTSDQIRKIYLSSKIYNKKLNVYSAGIKKTSVYKEVIFSLSRTGLKISGDGKVKYEENEINLTSKTLDDIKKQKFIGVMTCSNAEKSCPIDQRSIKNINMFYRDPKDFDKTNKKIKEYDDTCLKIAQELNYVFKKIN